MLSECRMRELSNGKCQLLLSKKSILSAMTHMDLTPIRAKVAESVSSFTHTRIRIRGKAVRGDLKAAAIVDSHFLDTIVGDTIVDTYFLVRRSPGDEAS